MKIVFYETEPWEERYLREKLQNFEVVFRKSEDLSPDAEVEILSNFVAFPITQQVLAAFPNLKYVTTRSTGYDHINLQLCQEKNIVASNVPAYGENTVAEFTFALLLALGRKIYPAIQRTKEHGKFNTEGLEGFDLLNKTIGIIGTGHIGTYAIKIAHGFGMNILAYDPYPKADLAAQFNFKYVTLEELLGQSDIISLHVPYMPATHHLLNEENFKLCKKGCVIVNSARGGLIDSQALIKALKDGTVAGAALDVLEEEGFMKEDLEMLFSSHPNEQQLKTALVDLELLRMDNVIITPHNAFNTKEALLRILDTTADNIKAFVSGKPIHTVRQTG